MLRAGHMGLSGGMASAVSAIWIRKKIREEMEPSPVKSTVRGRVRQRGKYALAGIAFTGCATLVSGSIDTVEKQLGFSHRTVGHSLPWLVGVYATARIAKQSGFEVLKRIRDYYGISGTLRTALDELEELTSWVLDGGIYGAITHSIGDIPTYGHGGTALRLLAPLTDAKINLDMYLAASPVLNEVSLAVGALLAAVSWGVIGAYLVAPMAPEQIIKEKTVRLARWMRTVTPCVRKLSDWARESYDLVNNLLRKVFSFSRSVTCEPLVASQNVSDSFDIFSDSEENPTGIPLLTEKSQTQSVIGEPLQSENQQGTGVPLQSPEANFKAVSRLSTDTLSSSTTSCN